MWFRLTDDVFLSPKIRAVGPEGCLLWQAACCYCNRLIHDRWGSGDEGFIPEHDLLLIAGEAMVQDVRSAVALLTKRSAATGSPLWHRVKGGFLIHHYIEHQFPDGLPVSADEKKKADQRRRAQAYRDRKKRAEEMLASDDDSSERHAIVTQRHANPRSRHADFDPRHAPVSEVREPAEPASHAQNSQSGGQEPPESPNRHANVTPRHAESRSRHALARETQYPESPGFPDLPESGVSDPPLESGGPPYPQAPPYRGAGPKPDGRSPSLSGGIDLSPEQEAVSCELIAFGLEASDARRLAARPDRTPAMIRDHIAAMAYRDAEDPVIVLIRSIEGGWRLPKPRNPASARQNRRQPESLQQSFERNLARLQSAERTREEIGT